MKRLSLAVIGIIVLTGCSRVSNAINPYYKTPPREAYAGIKSDDALTGGGKAREEKALQSIKSEIMSQQSFEHSPAPYKPVVRPAVIRLMWVPDRLNRHGDLIPAHYYYLKILNDSFVLEDAFEVNAMLNATTKGPGSGGIPFIYKTK